MASRDRDGVANWHDSGLFFAPEPDTAATEAQPCVTCRKSAMKRPSD